MTKQAKKFDSPIGSDSNAYKIAVFASGADSPPPAPIAAKRRRYMALVDDDEEEDQEEGVSVVKRSLVKKLGDDFDRVAMENERNKGDQMKDRACGAGSGTVGLRTRSRVVKEEAKQVTKSHFKGKKLVGRSGGVSGVRTSPRLAKRGV